MRRRSLVLQLGVVAALTLALGACSGSTDEGNDTAGSDVTEMAEQDGLVDGVLPDAPDGVEEVGEDLGPDTTDVGPDDVVEEISPDVVTVAMPSLEGQIVISEFMAQSTVGNDAGEWVELYNASDAPLDLKGCLLKDAATDSAVISSSLVVAPGDYVVLGVSMDKAVNGGLEPDFVMVGYLLANDGDTILLECGSKEIDKVVYDAGWVLNGVARQLSNDKLDHVSNDVKANWCLAGFNYGGKGKLGSPGTANELCFIANPCEPNPCSGAPANACQDSTNLKTYKVPGQCTVDAGQAVCEFETEIVDCSKDSKVCKNGACVVPPDPCVPNPCTTPPAPTCDGNTAKTFEVPGQCANVDNEAECTYTPKDIDCVALGKICLTGACQYEGQGVAPNAVGQVIVSELMPKSQANTDPGEWFELYNTTDVALDLNGCIIKDEGSDSHTIGVPLVIPAKGYLLIAKNEDPALNHGLEPDYVASFALGNSGDAVILKCGAFEIDKVKYASSWITEGVSIQLSNDQMTHEANDLLINWCPSTATYGTADKKGTPGLPNVKCVKPLAVDLCRLQEPLDIEQEAGTEVSVKGRVTALTITDLTTGNDADPLLVGQAGYGPTNTNPSSSLAWNWFDAMPVADWDAMAAGELNMDEYEAKYDLPGVGNYHHAYRFSVDGGSTWTYCDRDAGEGMDGSQNGYQVTNAGTIKATPGIDPCVPNPCTTPDEPSCTEDGVFVKSYATPGTCTVVDDLPSCEYTEQLLDCSLDGKSCAGGVCVAEGEGNTPTEKGQILVTEVMPKSQDGSSDDGEWFEIFNNTAMVLDLGGCKVTDLEGTSTLASPFLIGPGEYMVFARSADPVKNHGIEADFVYASTLQLANGGDQIIVSCGEVTVDQVDYDGTWVMTGVSIQLSNDLYDEELNDDLAAWCLSTSSFGTAGKLGTPGLENILCEPPPPPTVDWCRFQHPTYAEVAPGGEVNVYVRIYEEGVTTVTPQVDTIVGLVTEAGFGAEGTDPAMDSGWVWTLGTATPDWNANTAGEPNNDEYMATLTAPSEEAILDMAWRISLDSGENWVYCDLDKGDGMDGSEDGYSPDNAAVLMVIEPVDPCTPNPCTEIPAATCQSPTVAVTYGGPGACSVVNDAAECDYTENVVDCAIDGKTCLNGACILPGQGDKPGAGEVFFTEFMANSQSGTDDGEWVELYNIASVPLDLGGCVLKDNGTNTHTILGTLVVQPGDFVVLGKSLDPLKNWGAPVDYVYTNYFLGNSGDALILECDGTIIDQVEYTSAMISLGVSTQLSTLHFDDVENDEAANWCLSKADFGTDGKKGTPGSDNWDCVPNTVDWCRFQHPLTGAIEAGQSLDVFGRIYEAGVTDQTTGIDAFPGLVVQAGYGADGSTPDNAWMWVDATAGIDWDGSVWGENNNDEYKGVLTVSVAGTYDMAFRVAIDNGPWTYCDTDAGDGMDGSENGYQVEYAASLEVAPQSNPCDPNPCIPVKLRDCDGNTAVEYASPGTCTVVDSAASCEYAENRLDCTLDGKVCVNGLCEASGGTPNPYFSEYVEGASNNKAVEIYNGGTADLDLSTCAVKLYSNGSAAASSTMALTGTTLAAGQVYVLCNSSIADTTNCDQTTGTLTHNGDDALELVCDGVTYDIIGQIGFDPGTAWVADSVSTLDMTLRVRCSITAGDTNGTDVYDPSVPFAAFAKDDLTDLGTYTCANN